MASISSTVCVFMFVCVCVCGGGGGGGGGGGWGGGGGGGGGVENKTLAQGRKNAPPYILNIREWYPLWCWLIVVICMYDALFHMPLD